MGLEGSQVDLTDVGSIVGVGADPPPIPSHRGVGLESVFGDALVACKVAVAGPLPIGRVHPEAPDVGPLDVVASGAPRQLGKVHGRG